MLDGIYKGLYINDYVMTLSNVNLWFVGMTKMGHSSGVHNIA